MKKIFYSQPVDFIDHDIVVQKVADLQVLFKNLDIVLVAPYLKDAEHQVGGITRSLAKELIRKDYEAIDNCDVLLADLSLENHQAIGVVFEMAYAWQRQKKIIVYTGSSNIAERVWIVAIADHVCRSWGDVRVSLEIVLQEF